MCYNYYRIINKQFIQQWKTTNENLKATGVGRLAVANQLLRYQAVMNEFNAHDARYIPITVIWREFIYPKFFISRKTLYHILNIDVEQELKNLNL